MQSKIIGSAEDACFAAVPLERSRAPGCLGNTTERAMPGLGWLRVHWAWSNATQEAFIGHFKWNSVQVLAAI